MLGGKRRGEAWRGYRVEAAEHECGCAVVRRAVASSKALQRYVAQAGLHGGGPPVKWRAVRDSLLERKRRGKPWRGYVVEAAEHECGFPVVARAVRSLKVLQRYVARSGLRRGPPRQWRTVRDSLLDRKRRGEPWRGYPVEADKHECAESVVWRAVHSLKVLQWYVAQAKLHRGRPVKSRLTGAASVLGKAAAVPAAPSAITTAVEVLAGAAVAPPMGSAELRALGFAPASSVQRRLDFDSFKQLHAFLKRHPEIRVCKPSANRLWIHLAEAVHWKDQEDKEALKALDVGMDVVADTKARIDADSRARPGQDDEATADRFAMKRG